MGGPGNNYPEQLLAGNGVGLGKVLHKYWKEKAGASKIKNLSTNEKDKRIPGGLPSRPQGKGDLQEVHQTRTGELKRESDMPPTGGS